MARNGAGTYVLPAGNPVVTGTVISSTTNNNTMTDIATALSGSIAANGETPITANIPFGGFNITGVGAITATTANATTGNITTVAATTVNATTVNAHLVGNADTATTATNVTGSGTVSTTTVAGTTISATTRINVGVNQVLPTNGYNISTPNYGGAIELRSNSATADRGFRLGMRDGSTGFVPHMTFLDSDPTLRVDCGLTSSSPTLGIGYGTGAGGTVTQITNIGTAVTLNKICGAITCANNTYVTGGTVSFIVNNTAYAVGDVVVAITRNGGVVSAVAEGNGAGVFYVTLTSLANATAVVIVDFIIIKAVSA